MASKIKNYLGQFGQAPRSTVIGITLVLLTWLAAALIVAGLVIWSGERSGQAQIDPEGTELPVILLEPASGPAGSFVTIWGEDWPADDTVLIYLLAEDQNQIPDYAVANAVTDADGRFVTGVTLPSGPLWDDQETITIIARVDRSGPVAQAAFRIEGELAPLVDAPTVDGDQTTDTPTPEPSDTPTITVEPTLALTVPVPTVTPVTETAPPLATTKPSLTSIANLNVRTGPGLDYPVVGLLPVGQSAEVTGVSSDGLWWQIYFPAAASGRGWVSAYYVTVQNTAGVPVVQAPPPPAPTTAPPAQTWRGEYYANPILSFEPALVRNDPAIDFNWGTGAPVSQLPAERFSVRWTRRQAFDEGLYRFHAIVDDGVRLYVDDTLVIDEWRDGAARQLTGERWLSAGYHNLRVEYYDNTYESVIRVWWERADGAVPTYPDWKGEYWPNRNLSGSPVIVRNDWAPDFNWGYGSPGAGLPADNFSARWTSDLYLTEGRYRFHLVADDGVRLWVDGHLFVDKWWDGRHDEWAEAWLGSGSHRVQLEYYEYVGEAYIHLWADRISDSGGDASREPEADFDADRRSGIAPLEVEFDNDSEGDYDECKWYFGDGDTSRDCTDPKHTYREAGTYTVKLKVWNDDDDDEEDTREREDYITVYAPVRADFSASPRSGAVPLTVSFTNGSSGDYNQCLWSFGDGSTSNACQPDDHQYTAAGTYDVHLAVGGSGGRDVESKFSYIVANPPANQPPTAVINGPTIGLVGDPLDFDGSISSDPDGTIVSYSWVFGDGTTGSGASVSHSYGNPGSYNVALTVADNGGLDDTSTYTVIIEETAGGGSPVAAINGPATALVGETVIFDSDGSYDPDGTIVDYIWDFDVDEVPMLTQAAESTVAHVYDAPGTYQVSLTVVDNEGQRDTATRTITIIEESTTNEPPVAVINGPTTALAGETVTFDSEGSEDPDGEIISYRWDFGDRNPSDMVQLAQSGDSTMAHIYADPGNYQVTLTVIDNDGARAEATQMIAIEGPALNQPPRAVINAPTNGTVGDSLDFDGSSSSDPDGTIVSYSWVFGDGTTASGATVSHSYSTADDYTVSLTVTDDEGSSDSSSYTLPIEEPSSQTLSDQSTGSSATPTATPEPSPAPSATPTATPQASPTATAEPSRQPAQSPAPDSDQPTATSEPATSTPTPSATATQEPTTSTEPAETTTEPATATAEPTTTPTDSPTATPTPTPRPPTATPTPEPPTPTPRPPTATPTPTPRPPTATSTPRPPTATPTPRPPTATATPVPPPPTSEPAAPPPGPSPVASPSVTATVGQSAGTLP
jgi:PKD repeat protein